MLWQCHSDGLLCLPAACLLPLPGVLHGSHSAEHHGQPGLRERLRRSNIPGEAKDHGGKKVEHVSLF